VFSNPRKTKATRRLGFVDIAELREAVIAIPESVWDHENTEKPNRFDALDATGHIVFRFVSSFRDWRDAYDRPIWQDWRYLVQPVLDAATAAYGYERGSYPRIMLARMGPGGVIRPHRDANPAARWPHKVHVPLCTNEGVVFSVDGVDCRMAEGEAVELNNMGLHAVENRGKSDRIHLIFEYYDVDQPTPDWVDSQLVKTA
jgi:Aspartyl/Asparaginyl beta-hydroxylase